MHLFAAGLYPYTITEYLFANVRNAKSLHVGLLPSCGLVSLHTADLEAMSRPQLRVPPTSDRVLLNGRHAHFHTLNKSLSSSIWDGIVE